MTLYQALELMETPYDVRYAVLLACKGYPFSTYVVIPSDTRFQYYELCLGIKNAAYYPDIGNLLNYCLGKLLPTMSHTAQESDDWHVFSGEEFINFNESLWRKPNDTRTSY
jgi:hypothetical protein